MNTSKHVFLIYPQKNTLLFGVPLGIAYLAAVLREAGHAVSIIDLRYESEEALFSKLAGTYPDIVGFYASSEIAPYILSLAAEIKKRFQDTKLIVGGPFSTIDPGYFLKHDFDVAVKGEGEATIIELVEALRGSKGLEKVNGISYKANEKILENPPREFIENLDTLPFPAFDLFPKISETLNRSLAWPNLHPFTHIILSRGCPFQCSFCQPTLSRVFGKKVRRLSPQRAIELLSFLKQKFGIKEVFFEDDLLLSKSWKDWLSDLTDLMLKTGLNIRWWGQGRADTVDEEILIKAKKAGCYMVMCGVESGCQKTLNFYNKGITPQQIRNLFALCKKQELLSIAEIIFGAPEETLQDAQETIDLVKEVKPDMIWVSILTPYPGTHLTEWLIEHKIEYEMDLSRIDRRIRRKRIASVMTEDQVLKACSKITQSSIFLSRIFTKRYYRKIYLAKIDNLISRGEYAKLLKFLVWTFTRPALNPLYLTYLRYSELAGIKTLKNIFNRLRAGS
jgi:radical SAM superfamily enzyme YgiQ (UPF0313 family)